MCKLVTLLQSQTSLAKKWQPAWRGVKGNDCCRTETATVISVRGLLSALLYLFFFFFSEWSLLLVEARCALK